MTRTELKRSALLSAMIVVSYAALAACDQSANSLPSDAAQPAPSDSPVSAAAPSNGLSSEQWRDLTAAQNEGTESRYADSLVGLLAVHQGDAFPTPQVPAGQTYWDESFQLDAQAAQMDYASPDGRVVQTDQAKRLRQQAEWGRRRARQYAAAIAIAYAISAEPDAWRLSDGKLESPGTWVVIRGGEHCVAFGARMWPDSELGCASDAEDIKTHIWDAYQAWAPAHSKPPAPNPEAAQPETAAESNSQ